MNITTHLISIYKSRHSMSGSLYSIGLSSIRVCEVKRALTCHPLVVWSVSSLTNIKKDNYLFHENFQ